MANTATTGFLHSMYEAHMLNRAQKMLYKTPVLYELCDKHPLPGGNGTTIYIPKQATPNTGAALSETSVRTPSATSSNYYTGTVTGWGDAKAYSDFLVMVKSVPALISDDITAMTKFAGYWVDDEIYDELSGAGTWLSPDNSTIQTSVLSTTPLKQDFLFRASTTLASNDAPTYDDGNYAGVFHPKAIYDLFVSTSAGSQLGTYGKYGATSFLEGTESGYKKLESMTIGVLGKVRVLESTQSCEQVASDKTIGTSGHGDNSAHPGFVMGPGACAAVDLQTARLKPYLKALGSAGTADPLDQITTAGVKLYFAAVAMDTDYRLVRTASGTTL